MKSRSLEEDAAYHLLRKLAMYRNKRICTPYRIARIYSLGDDPGYPVRDILPIPIT
jgi:hypothetical protein